MARVTAQGIEPTTLQGYIVTLTETDEALVAVGNGMSRSRALGVQLDDLGSPVGHPTSTG